MILLLDTSTPVCLLTLVDDMGAHELQWQAERQLAGGLLTFIHEQLSSRGCALSDIQGIGVYRGPGSFTGLRIGMTVLNTLADSLRVPIVGTIDDTWKQVALDRLYAGEDDRIVLPLYGSDANITKPRK